SFLMEEYIGWPDRYYVAWDLDLAGVRHPIIEVLRGDRAWGQEDGNTTENDPAKTREMQEQAYANYVSSLVPLLDGKEYRLALLPAEKSRGRAVVGVKVSSTGHPDVRLIFDSKTHFLIKMEYRSTNTVTGREMHVEDFPDDYREVTPGTTDEEK